MTKRLKPLARTLLSAVVALVVSAGAVTALAQSQGISMSDAERIALQLFPGATVESVEREVKRGVEVYEVELHDDRGVEHEILIDAHDGHVIRSRVDD
jgi:uncharacterized membrane protein YkoI